MSNGDIIGQKMERLRLKLKELEQVWRQATENINLWQESLYLASQPEEKVRLRKLIESAKLERQKTEDEIDALEKQLGDSLPNPGGVPNQPSLKPKPRPRDGESADAGAPTLAEHVPLDPVTLDKNCPDCGNPLVARMGKKGAFIGCSSFPKCKYTSNSAGENCSECSKVLTIKSGKLGFFLGCSGFPQCRYTRNIVAPAKS